MWSCRLHLILWPIHQWWFGGSAWKSNGTANMLHGTVESIDSMVWQYTVWRVHLKDWSDSIMVPWGQIYTEMKLDGGQVCFDWPNTWRATRAYIIKLIGHLDIFSIENLWQNIVHSTVHDCLLAQSLQQLETRKTQANVWTSNLKIIVSTMNYGAINI